MKIVFVTSRITYVRDNYYFLLKTLSEHCVNDHISLLVIDNLTPGLVLKALAIAMAGARKTGAMLLWNMVTSFTGKREKLFRTCLRSKDINNRKTLKQLQTMKPDLIVNLRTREIYGPKILSIPVLGCINIHHGILPENRGTLCDLWALYEKRDVGFTIHYMNERIDSGDIIAVHTSGLNTVRDYSKVPMQSSFREARALLDVIERFRCVGKVKGIPNTCKTIRFSKTPTFNEIRTMKKSELIL